MEKIIYAFMGAIIGAGVIWFWARTRLQEFHSREMIELQMGYAEKLTEVEGKARSSETLVNEDGLLGLYMTRRNAEGQDSLITDGTLVRPKLIAERSVPEAEVHHIEAGVYHLTTIPLEQLVATLVVDSPAFVESTGVLLASTKPQIARNRRMVDRSSAMLAREQIMVHHGLR